MEGHVPTCTDYAAWHGRLDAIVNAAYTRSGHNIHYFYIAVRLTKEMNSAGISIAACRIPTDLQIEQCGKLTIDASVEEIEEGLRLFNNGAGFEATHSQVELSILINKSQAADQNYIKPDGSGDWAAARLSGIADITPTQAELEECSRMRDVADYTDTVDLYATVKDALRIRNLPTIDGVPNPYADGLNSDQITEAKRLRTAAAPNPFAGGVNHIQLAKSLELPRKYSQFDPSFADGAFNSSLPTPAEVVAYIYLQTLETQTAAQTGIKQIVKLAVDNIRACALLQTQQIAGGGAAIATPHVRQVGTVGRIKDTAMKLMFVRAMQNRIPGLTDGANVPYGIGKVEAIAGGIATIKFVLMDGISSSDKRIAHLYNHDCGMVAGFGARIPARYKADALRVGIDASSADDVDGRIQEAQGIGVNDYVVFADIAEDKAANNADANAHLTLLRKVAKVN